MSRDIHFIAAAHAAQKLDLTPGGYAVAAAKSASRSDAPRPDLWDGHTADRVAASLKRHLG